jgi:pimeloyl-ACP methyl ester carboxylesterase
LIGKTIPIAHSWQFQGTTFAVDVEHCADEVVSVPFGQHKIDALFRAAVSPTPSQNSLVVLRLHGILGNLLDETEHFLPMALAERGYASISVNAALANLGLFYGFGVIDDVIPQIAAVCNYLQATGFTMIVLAGHGLGAAMAVRYAAAINDASVGSPIHGVVAIAAPYSFPQTIRSSSTRRAAQRACPNTPRSTH